MLKLNEIDIWFVQYKKIPNMYENLHTATAKII